MKIFSNETWPSLFFLKIMAGSSFEDTSSEQGDQTSLGDLFSLVKSHDF